MAGGQQSSVLATKSHMASKNPIESAEDQTHVLPDRAQVKNSNRAQSPLSAKGQSKNPNPSKRARHSGSSYSNMIDSDSDSDDETVAGVWPRFLVVEGADPENSLDKLDPWAIKKGFKGVSSSINKIEDIRDGKGSLCVECPTKSVSDALLGRDGTIFVDRKIKVTPHRSKNFCKGVIFCRRLSKLSEDTILKGLKSQGVVGVKRFGKGDTTEQGHTYLLTFAIPTLPETVNIGYFRTKVKMYIPQPRRCFKCQKFGHVASRCRNKAICKHCGHEAHDNECSQPLSCPNCKGGHGPRSKKCPKYIEEQTISKIKTERKVSYLEAKRIYLQTTPVAGTSFADVVAKFTKKYASCSTQIGGGIPQEELKRLRGCRWKRSPFIPTDKATGSTLPSKGSKVPASAHQAAGTKKAQPSPGSSSTPPASASQAAEGKQAEKSAPPKPAPGEQAENTNKLAKAILTAPRLTIDKWKTAGSRPLRGENPVNVFSQGSSAASQKDKRGGKRGDSAPRKSPPRLTKAERDPLSTFNRYSNLSDNPSDEDMEFHSS